MMRMAGDNVETSNKRREQIKKLGRRVASDQEKN